MRAVGQPEIDDFLRAAEAFEREVRRLGRQGEAAHARVVSLHRAGRDTDALRTGEIQVARLAREYRVLGEQLQAAALALLGEGMEPDELPIDYMVRLAGLMRDPQAMQQTLQRNGLVLVL